MYGMVARDISDPSASRVVRSSSSRRAHCASAWRRRSTAPARHGTALSCLLLDIADLPALRRAHGELLAERVLAYVELALRRELRRFDRVGRASEGELLVVLPGADAPARGARRAADPRAHALDQA